ncbi:uncharacterized protein LOC110245518 [Exaiptasia diaphana]|uniref:Uncharacterized protein n=1 Tax=Exaiptasia diaphana TaxID=2652724 RepID=A0A913YRN4_EXADI|nr:uncharacterized protein LOC110245518 [Exaiptasia diaphana]
MQIKWKKFGWMTFFFNLSIYIAFLLCFTSLVVIMRSNEERFCGLNPTNTKVCTSSIIMKGKRNSTLAKNSITKWVSSFTDNTLSTCGNCAFAISFACVSVIFAVSEEFVNSSEDFVSTLEGHW